MYNSKLNVMKCTMLWKHTKKNLAIKLDVCPGCVLAT